MPNKEQYTLSEYAREKGIHVKTAYLWIVQKKIRAKKNDAGWWMIPASELNHEKRVI